MIELTFDATMVGQQTRRSRHFGSSLPKAARRGVVSAFGFGICQPEN